MSRLSLHDIPELIDWHEGMLLTPQHFEQLTLRQECLSQYYALNAPYGWGVRQLTIDKTQLLRGLFRILELETILPDGLAVCYRASNGEDLSLALNAIPDSVKHQVLTVYLAVPVLSTELSRGELLRYVSNGAYPGSEEDQIAVAGMPRLRPRMQLLAATDPVPAKFVSIPLAKIAYRNEIFELVEYMSPACQVALNSPVGIMCSTTVRRLRERAIYLSEQLRTFSAGGRNQLEAQQKTRIRGLVTGLPAFEALLSTGLTHPYHLYVAYCALAGQISVLGTTMITPLFPPYDHSELMESFGEVDSYINAVVREGIPEDYAPIPFVYKNGIFLLNFEADWAERRLILSVRCPPGVPHLDVLAWGEQSLIGSAELQRGMREKRVLGAPRHYLADEEGLVAGQGVVLYHLVYDPEYIRPNETLQVVGINSEGQNVRPSEIVLYVKHANS